ncbi:MAG TPA: metallophosphatase domain-containing protein [Flavisolibacter sp.]|nr:metallophosphatase domain-containing protein [Flavisolibacter sp.]
MKFVGLADTHSRHRGIILPKGDVLIHGGDISYRGERLEVEDFLAWFAKQDFEYKVFIAGNHDFLFENIKPKELERIIPPGIIYLNDSGTDIQGIHIWGSPITPKFFNWAFNRTRGEAIKKHWKLIPANTDLLITHGPPHGILDQVANESHVGCVDLLQTVKSIMPRVHFFGHIHESYGIRNSAQTKFINACQMNELYQLVNKPVVFEL